MFNGWRCAHRESWPLPRLPMMQNKIRIPDKRWTRVQQRQFWNGLLFSVGSWSDAGGGSCSMSVLTITSRTRAGGIPSVSTATKRVWRWGATMTVRTAVSGGVFNCRRGSSSVIGILWYSAGLSSWTESLWHKTWAKQGWFGGIQTRLLGWRLPRVSGHGHEKDVSV